tara:strand:+ start:133 stop:408 length:276 start_codon:yes stop_codon:yes gene_type:complete
VAVDADTVRQMAKLARLDVADERIAALSSEMSAILDHMGTISTWDEAGVPTDRPAAVRRNDTPLPTQEGLITSAAKVDQTSVVVPPVKGAS